MQVCRGRKRQNTPSHQTFPAYPQFRYLKPGESHHNHFLRDFTCKVYAKPETADYWRFLPDRAAQLEKFPYRAEKITTFLEVVGGNLLTLYDDL